jgi:hypothetical protein
MAMRPITSNLATPLTLLAALVAAAALLALVEPAKDDPALAAHANPQPETAP